MIFHLIPCVEKGLKKTRVFRLCFKASQCPLHTDRLWIKATSLFGTAVLLTWSKGKASASGHYHYHFTIFLPACYMGFPLQVFFFFFLSSVQTNSPFSCLGKRTWNWWGTEGSYIWSFLCLLLNILYFLLEGVVVIYVVLVNISYVYWVLGFNIFYRSLYSTANSASSQLLVFPYFTQPRENSLTYFSVENLARKSLSRKKKKEIFLPKF